VDKTVVSKKWERKVYGCIRESYRLFMAEIKGTLLLGGLFNMTGLYNHSQPPTGCIYNPDHWYKLPLCFKKQLGKADH